MYDFKFMVSIFDLIDNPDFEMLCMLLSLNIKSEWIEQEYDDIKRGQGDVYLFQSQSGCLLLDLFQEPTDQNEMVLVGVRCKREMRFRVKAVVEVIYNKAPIKSTKLTEGSNILDKLISRDSYPVERPTITTIDGKEVYRFLQKLKLFYCD